MNLVVPKFEGEEGKEEQTQSIPPISTFAKRTGNASEEYSPPTSTYFSNNNGRPMAELEGNNNNGSAADIPRESSPGTSPGDAKPSGETVLLLQHHTPSQSLPQHPPGPQHHQPGQLLQQTSQSAYQYGNPQVLVSTAAPVSNGVHVIHSGPVPTSVIPSGMHMQGALIPFLTSNNASQPQGVISHLPADQMLQYSSAAAHFATPPGIQATTSQPQATVIQVNETTPFQPAILPHNIDLHHHVQQQQQHQEQHQQQVLKTVKDIPPLTPPASADEKDNQENDSRKSLATIAPHPQLQPPMQSGPTARPVLPAHLMQYNPTQSTAALSGHLPPNFVPGPVPVQGPIAMGNYGNVQVVPPQQMPPVTIQHPMGPPGLPNMGDQQNPMLGGPGPGMDMQGTMDADQPVSGSSAGKRHAQSKRRGNKRDVPPEEKDDRYFERRKRNNQAAKRSRDARKTREEQIGMRAHYLEKENDFLRAQLNTLREEANSLRLLLAQRPPVSQMPSGPPPPM